MLKRGKQFFLLVLALMVLMTACSTTNPTGGEPAQDVEVGVESPASVVIEGLKTEEIVLEVKDLKELPAISREVTSVNSSGAESRFEVTGALLDEILKTMDSSQENLAGIRFVAGDGYSVEVPGEILAKRDIILAYEVDGAPLDAESQPLRVIIPEERAMYWVSNLKTIEVLIEENKKSEIKTVLFLETLKESMDLKDYNYNESIDKAIKNEDLLADFKGGSPSNTVYLEAVDGLEKNETLSNFESAYIKITGTDAPTFLAPEMPKGMTVKEILYFAFDDIAWVSYEKLQEKFGPSEIADVEGIKLKDLFEKVGFIEDNSYVFVATDGYMVEIEASDIDKGVVYQDDKGRVNVLFEGLPKNTTVKELLSIKTVEK